MLVLSRRKQQRILIGDEIEICIVDIEADKVRIGIEAPRSIPIIRDDANVIVPRACEPGQEGGDLRTTDTIPGVHRDGREGLAAGEAVDPDHEELLRGATVPAEPG